jgi:hypothetical protein
MTKGRTIGKKIPLLAVMLLFCMGLRAQQVEFTAGAPRMIEAGTAFKVEFTLTTDSREATPSDFSGPAFSGVNVIAGPQSSSWESHTNINGRQSDSYVYVYTYVVSAPTEGTITVPGASVTVAGRSHTTQPLRIEVVATGTASGAQPGQPGQQGTGQNTTSLAKDDVLLRIVPNRTSVYKGEPIRVQLKIYTRANLARISDVKYPAFNGFWNQEIPVNDPGRQEEYNGKLYQSQVIREFLLFPQQAGTLSIEQFSMSALAQVVTQSRRQSLFDDFFGGGPQVLDIPLNLSAGPIPITVKEWPAGAPAGFNGAVGQFRLEGGPDRIDIPANSAANFDLRISGTGNLPLIAAPTIEMPASFEQYTVKTTDDFAPAGGNMSGSKTFSVPFIPRGEGEYAIPPVEFVYFDPATARYVTLRTSDYTLRIGQDTGGGNTPSGLVSGTNKEDLKILGQDIRFIRIADPKLRRVGTAFLFSWGYWGALLLILIAFVAALAWLRKRIRLRNDRTLTRNRRAQKVALRRLKTAEKYMLAKDSAGFYDEMLKALWGYMSDKLNIPVSNLSRDNVKQGLADKGIESEWADRYISTIAECEYMQYAPSDKTQIGDVYNSAVELISKMESKI